MTTTTPVEIPADVKDNSTHSIRIQWRGTRDAQPDEIESGRRYLATFGYTLYEWDDTDAAGTRVTLHRFVNREGQTVDLFATYYFTRVPCILHDADYADFYASVTDGETGETTTVAPYCDECMIQMRRSSRDNGDTVNESERLVIGQHD